MIPLLLAACAPTTPEVPPAEAPPPELPAPDTAKRDTWREMVLDRDTPRHPSDGGGALRLVSADPERVAVGQSGRWTLAFTVGPLGIAEGGAVVFQPPPFWGWSPPQSQAREAPGFTEITTAAEGVVLKPQAAAGMIVCTVEGRALRPGEEVQIAYGAGPAGARADRFAEREAALFVGVDGDGDGVRALVEPPVLVEVSPGPPRRLLVTLPSAAEPGQPVPLTLAVLDAVGNAWVPGARTVELQGRDVPEVVQLEPGDRGQRTVVFTPSEEGLYAVAARTDDGLVGLSNPLVVRSGIEPILWADLQIHSALSDGTGAPEDLYRYARHVAGLDVAAVTDHDHWGLQFLDQHPELWERLTRAAQDANEPGRFVALVGYEWTSWLYGHRHVLYFGDSGPLLSSLDDRTDTPEELWRELRGHRALTLPHHPAGGPVALDWSRALDPELEPIAEVASVHGQSVSASDPGAIYEPVEGHFADDQLRAGRRFGMLGSTDGHDGHPGLSHLAAPSGGLAAILAKERTREAVLEALRARRVYATNGVRMILRMTVDGAPMGSVVGGGPVEVELRVLGTADVEQVSLIGRTGEVASAVGAGPALHRTWTVEPAPGGDFLYARVLQADGGVGWTSPVWIEP